MSLPPTIEAVLLTVSIGGSLACLGIAVALLKHVREKQNKPLKEGVIEINQPQRKSLTQKFYGGLQWFYWALFVSILDLAGTAFWYYTGQANSPLSFIINPIYLFFHAPVNALLFLLWAVLITLGWLSFTDIIRAYLADP